MLTADRYFTRPTTALALAASLCGWLLSASAVAAPLSSNSLARLAASQPVDVVVEYAHADVDAAAAVERTRRGLAHDDAVIQQERARRYATTKSSVEAAVGAADARRTHDYPHLPMSVWRISSLTALQRLQSNPTVKAVHENITVHVDSVSDLSFINQSQTMAEGGTGAGTTVAIIDGGLGSNYTAYSDFGPCTAVAAPASTCRVVYNVDYYSGSSASSEVTHGTNVSAIVLGVASQAQLAMFDVFQKTSASAADIINAIDTIVQYRSTYNIVAVNMSFGDGTSNGSQCGNSVFATPISNLLGAGILPVVAAGNSGSKTGLSDPACVPGVISVGAVYSAATGTWQWPAPADSGGVCTDTSASDLVTCFSQSASYLSVLAPGTFVNAPNASFQQSGTSQATPHVSGDVAVLRARYPAEPLSQTLARLRYSNVNDTDPGNQLSLPRLNMLTSINEGTAVALSGTGPTQATAGGTGTYTLTATNSGPLEATDVVITDVLPAGAAFVSASSGCHASGSTITCNKAALAANTTVTFTINVQWSTTGAVYDSANLTLDQIDSSSSSQQLAFGTAPSSDQTTDGPLPLWSDGLLIVGLLGSGWIAQRTRLAA